MRVFSATEAHTLPPPIQGLADRRDEFSKLPPRVRFTVSMTVSEYIEETNPPAVRELLFAAHCFLQETLPPFATCAIKWRVPFYSLHRNFCYLNRHRDHITLGFRHGYKLAPQPGVLLGESERLKHVRYIEIRSIEELYSDETLQLLQEAVILDEMFEK